MLRNTFCHVPGISITTERRLWSAGVQCWDDLGAAAVLPVTGAKADALRRCLELSRERLEAGDAEHFAQLLPTGEHWRLFGEFRNAIAYIDIETTGLSPIGSYVTTIALYDGHSVRHYVHGENLGQFERDIADYGLIVTYNGKCFDVPFIRQSMGVVLRQPHIDLRYVLRSLGYSGGLKGCERKLGIERGDLADVDGFFAVILWEDYLKSGNPRSLETLLAYNIQDVVNLETLLVIAYNLKIGSTPFAQSHRMAAPTPPPLPFRADAETVQRLRRQSWWSPVAW